MSSDRHWILCCRELLKFSNRLAGYDICSSKTIKTSPYFMIKKKMTIIKKKYLADGGNSPVVIQHKVASSVIKQMNSEFKYLYGPLQTSKNESYDRKNIPNSNQIIQHETRIPIRDPNEDTESIKLTDSESLQNDELKNSPILIQTDLNVVLNFPLMNKPASKQSASTKFEISELNTLRKYLEEKSSSLVPSISLILDKTMPFDRAENLRRWKENMITQLGEEGFQKYKTELLANGTSLHCSINNYLASTHEEELQIEEGNNGHWKSLKAVFPQISEVKLLEERILHPFLCYKGIVDCFAKYRDHLVVIDWKTSKKKKSSLSSTFDNPLQIAAYVGALNFDPRFQYLVNKGLIVVAYENGDPASVLFIDGSTMQRYWKDWLKRIKLYWELCARKENS